MAEKPNDEGSAPAGSEAEAAQAPQEKAPAKREDAPISLKVILGEKVGMTQIFAADGECKPVTELKAGPCTVVRVKSAGGKDGYAAVVLSFDECAPEALRDSDAGQFKAAGVNPARRLREFRVADASPFKAGQRVGLADRFSPGDYVDVQGTSRGKGFAGAMKRHGFSGLPASHGASDKERSPGSLTSRRSLGKVLSGQRMAGHMGHATITTQKIAVAAVEPERNRLYLNGSVPGPRGSFVIVRETVKRIKKVRPKVAQTKKKAGFAGKVEKAEVKK